MDIKLPSCISDKHQICIICEGREEYDYFNRLIEIGVWNELYKFDLVNADGNGSIPARYQDKYQNSSFDLVLIFCDTEKKPYEQYEDIKKKINDFHGITNASNEIIIFANPCTMQLMLSHIKDVQLTTPAKKQNSQLIQECFGIENYKAREDQRATISSLITKDNFEEMCNRIKALSDDDTVLCSTNFLKFVKYFQSPDASWISAINTKLEQE